MECRSEEETVESAEKTEQLRLEDGEHENRHERKPSLELVHPCVCVRVAVHAIVRLRDQASLARWRMAHVVRMQG